MNRRSDTGSGLFLMEMIVAVFFFILCASACILAFAKSDHMSRGARDSNGAVSAAQSVAEIWKAEGAEGLEGHFEMYDRETEPGEHRQIFWDENWRSIRKEEGREPEYISVLDFEDDGNGRETLSMVFCRPPHKAEQEPIFELQAARYVPVRERR